MPVQIDFFWSFRSPYSYLAMARMRALADDHHAADLSAGDTVS